MEISIQTETERYILKVFKEELVWIIGKVFRLLSFLNSYKHFLIKWYCILLAKVYEVGNNFCNYVKFKT